MNVSDIIQLTDEAKKLEIQGIVELGNLLESQDRIEKNPELFFQRTFLTDSIKEILEHIKMKDSKRSPFGCFSISGNYGSGKSHILITLFHVFTAPIITEKWLLDHNAHELQITNKYTTLTIPLNFIDTKNLWEPIFSQLNMEDIIQEIIDYPTIPQIKAAFMGKNIVIFFDEIEKWYQSIDDSSRKNRNKFFVQNLLHVANEKDSNLLVFISLLLEGTDLEEVINRQNPRRFDLHTVKEKREIIRFRLFEKFLNENLMNNTIENYLDYYYDSEFSILFKKGTSLPKRSELQTRFQETYPFHPEMLDILIARYQDRQKYGNVRGLLYLLSSVLSREIIEKDKERILIDTTDLVTLSDVDLYQEEILALNRPLTIDCRNDYERVKKIPGKNPELVRQVLSACLIYSINETPQDYANIPELLLLSSKPSSRFNPNEIAEEITELSGFCPHFHIINGTVAIRREINPEAEINLQSEDIPNKEGKELIATTLKTDFNQTKDIIVGILEESKIKDFDNRNLKILISLNPQLKTWTTLKPFIKDTIYQNSIIIIIPKTEKALFQDLTLSKLAKRVIVENRLLKETEKSTPKFKLLKTIQKTDTDHLSMRIKESYGFWLKYQDRDNLTPRKVVEFVDKAILSQTSSDSGIIKNKISEVVYEKGQIGIKVNHLKDDFYKIRGYPIIPDLTAINEILLNGCSKKEFVIQDSHARLFTGKNLPGTVNDEMIIFNSSFKDIPKFECEECQAEFESEQELKEHKKERHPEFECSICVKKFKFATDLQEHIESEHVEKEFRCEFCHLVYNNESELLTHVKEHHKKPEFSCPLCNETFSNAINLQKHVTEEHKSYECKICSKTFPTENELTHHINEAHNIPEFICKICSASFSKAEELQFHRITDHPEPVACHICEEKFPSKEQLNEHIINVHEVTPAEKIIRIIEITSLAALSREIEKQLLENDVITYVGLRIIVSVNQDNLQTLIPIDSFTVSETSTLSLNFELNVNASPMEIATFIQKLPFQHGKFSLNLNIRRK